MPAVAHSVDHERFRAQLQHFIYSYGISAYDLGLHLAHDPMRAYGYLKGTVLPTRATRQRWRRYMRNYRKSVLV